MVTEPQAQSNDQEVDDDDEYKTVYIPELNEYISYYDWLGDTCATSHIINQCEEFTIFTTFKKREV